MRRKAIAWLTILTLTIGLCGCGFSLEPTASDIRYYRESRSSDTAYNASSEKSERAKETLRHKDDAQPGLKSDKSSYSGVTFGSDQAVGYTGFEYLVEQRITITGEKSGKKTAYSVFVPGGDYTYSISGSAFGSCMGVDFLFSVDPYIRYNAADYTLEENMEYYIESELKYLSSSTYDVSIGDIQTIDHNGITCEASYVMYDEYEDEYSPIYALYSAWEMENGNLAFAEVMIDYNETTGKTDTLLDELSSFYGFEISLDSSFAENKMAEFAESDEFNPGTFNLEYMSFELPSGWEKAYESDDFMDVFIPTGNLLLANVAIVVVSDYSTEDVVDALFNDEGATDTYAETIYESLGNVTDVSISDYGETFMGHTVELCVEMDDGDFQESAFVYIAQDHYDVFLIYLIYLDPADEEALAEGQAALDMLFETGEMR